MKNRWQKSKSPPGWTENNQQDNTTTKAIKSPRVGEDRRKWRTNLGNLRLGIMFDFWIRELADSVTA